MIRSPKTKTRINAVKKAPPVRQQSVELKTGNSFAADWNKLLNIPNSPPDHKILFLILPAISKINLKISDNIKKLLPHSLPLSIHRPCFLPLNLHFTFSPSKLLSHSHPLFSLPFSRSCHSHFLPVSLIFPPLPSPLPFPLCLPSLLTRCSLLTPPLHHPL